MALQSLVVITIATFGTGETASNIPCTVAFAMQNHPTLAEQGAIQQRVPALPEELLHQTGQFVAHPLAVTAQRMKMDEMVREKAVMMFVKEVGGLTLDYMKPDLRRKLLERNQGQQAGEWQHHFNVEFNRRIKAVNKGPFGTKWLEFVPGNMRNIDYYLSFGSKQMIPGTAYHQTFTLNIVELSVMLKRRACSDVVDLEVPSFTRLVGRSNDTIALKLR